MKIYKKRYRNFDKGVRRKGRESGEEGMSLWRGPDISRSPREVPLTVLLWSTSRGGVREGCLEPVRGPEGTEVVRSVWSTRDSRSSGSGGTGWTPSGFLRHLTPTELGRGGGGGQDLFLESWVPISGLWNTPTEGSFLT